ncbi:MAG: hypothetical protein NT137_01360 [Methanomassiliicoccales archaeon]|nr:hypothetical protein [Methanomassiliicoccales archaeon]
MPRQKSRIRLNADELNLVTYGMQETVDGFVFFVAKKGRNIHLQIYFRDGRVNAHIKDTNRGQDKVWEMDVDAEEMAKKVTESCEKTIGHYNWNETYCVLSAKFLDLVGFPSKLNDPVPLQQNLLDVFRHVAKIGKSDDFFRRIRIRDGLRMGPLIGFQFSKSQNYVVLPLDEKRRMKMNLDWRHNFMRHMPMLVGVNEYLDYIDRENLIGWEALASNPQLGEKITEIFERLPGISQEGKSK